MEAHLISYYLGILIVLASHIYILMYSDSPIMSMKYHSYINIFAVCLIAYYFIHKENYIQF